MKKIKINEMLLVVIIGVVIISLFIFIFPNKTNKEVAETKDISSIIDPTTGGFTEELEKELYLKNRELLLSKRISISYEDFLDELENLCPYYKPDGVTYRSCLYDLLEKYDQDVNTLSDTLIKDTQIVISELKASDEFADAEENFLTSFIELNKNWKSYRDALCNTDHATNWSGSNQGGLITICQLYEAGKYIDRLIGYRFDWVGLQVSLYLQTNIQAKTKDFEEIINKERKYFSETEYFAEPIPVIWEARLDGCLASCNGAYFTKIKSDDEYLRFSGYYEDTSRIIEDVFLSDDIILEVSGNWIEIGDGYINTIFNGKYHPVLEIENIRIKDDL